MAYLKSGRRRAVCELDNTASLRDNGIRTTHGEDLRREGYDEEANIGLQIDPREAYREGANRLRDRDGELVRAWADQADGLVTFAALFSSVITTFIVECYKTLQPSTDVTTVHLLRQIAAQLNGTTLPPSETPAFEPALSDVLQNASLFASLICSLLAAGMGIFYKEWLREYTRDLPSDPHDLFRTVQQRYEGMQLWRMQAIISGISIFLQLGVGFFIVALVLFAWNLHPAVSLVLNVFAIIWVAFWIGSALCPLFSANCPFRAPLSRFFFALVSLARRIVHNARSWVAGKGWRSTHELPRTLEDREKARILVPGNTLDANALLYLFTTHWGEVWLADLNPCVEDLGQTGALKFLEELATLRCPPGVSLKDIAAGSTRVDDVEVLRLAQLWKRISEKARGQPPNRISTPETILPDHQSPGPTKHEESTHASRRPAPDRELTLVGPYNPGAYYGCSSDVETSSTSSTYPQTTAKPDYRMDKLGEDIPVAVEVSAVSLGSAC